MSDAPRFRNTYEVVRATWLTRKPSESSAQVAISSTALLALGAAMYLQNALLAGSWMSASGEAVFVRGEWWRLWSTLFAHGDLGHLASNTLLFFTLGYFVYGYFGWR